MMAPGRENDIRIQLAQLGAVVILVTLAGATGYMVLEGWAFIDALYMTVITLSTVGFGEVNPLTTGGQIFTTALIVAGVVVVAYLARAMGQHVVSGELTGRLRRRRMQRSIDQLSGHHIVCGFGRVGSQVVRDLQSRGRQCVIIESNDEVIAHSTGDYLMLQGDAVEDQTLESAGIDRASGLVAATGHDATNLFVTLSARTLSPSLVIVARANQPSSESKLRQAGATHVISPYTISGHRIAAQLLTPSIADFLDVVMHSGNLELWLEECRIKPNSTLDDQTVREANVRERSGANLLAIRRGEQGTMLTDLPVDARLQPGDTLIALGTREQLAALQRLSAS